MSTASYYPNQPLGTLNKRCPSCNKCLYIEPTQELGTCVHCGEPYEVVRTLGSSGKTGNSNGIRLRALPKYYTCTHCNETKSAKAFQYGKFPDNGHSLRCSDCTRKINREAFSRRSMYRVTA